MTKQDKITDIIGFCFIVPIIICLWAGTLFFVDFALRAVF